MDTTWLNGVAQDPLHFYTVGGAAPAPVTVSVASPVDAMQTLVMSPN